MKYPFCCTFFVFFLVSCQAQQITIDAAGNTLLTNASSDTTRVLITPQGNMGIGQPNPQDKLEVNGQIHARSVKVDLKNWADHVFQPKYNLLPLSSLERFINSYGHLPNIPTASAVRKEGINLGEMNRLLLQKIEELTLHLIEKDKQLNGLQAQIIEIKTQVDQIQKSSIRE